MPLRAGKACYNCRARKVKCDVEEQGFPCRNCRLDQTQCFVQKSRRGKYVPYQTWLSGPCCRYRKYEADLNHNADGRGELFHSVLPRLTSSSCWRLLSNHLAPGMSLRNTKPSGTIGPIPLDGVWSRLQKTPLRLMTCGLINLLKGTAVHQSPSSRQKQDVGHIVLTELKPCLRCLLISCVERS